MVAERLTGKEDEDEWQKDKATGLEGTEDEGKGVGREGNGKAGKGQKEKRGGVKGREMDGKGMGKQEREGLHRKGKGKQGSKGKKEEE